MTRSPFLWGTATSSHQIEGKNQKNDWWAWEQAGKVPDQSGDACDHYARFKDDFAMLSELQHNAHRFSLEWSRLEPEEGCWDDEAFTHYREVLQDLRARGIEPVVTLHHFTNPIWFANKGGWESPEAVFYFTRYVKKVVEAFSSDVRIWITLNEPLIYVYFGYLEGSWPPGIQSFPASLQVIRHLLQAHVESYRIIHQHYQNNHAGPVWVSIAKHVTSHALCREGNLFDRAAASMRHWFFNHLFVDAAISGFLFFPGVYCESLGGERTLDFIGMNYYTRTFIRFNGFQKGGFLGEMCDLAHHADQVADTNVMGWDIYPEGLREMLLRFKKYNLPILICENGICAKNDEQRMQYIRSHLEQIGLAMKQGVDVAGYFHWSLLDNFEWAHGFSPRFGIVEVGYKNFERKMRPSAQTLTEECRKLISRAMECKTNYLNLPDPSSGKNHQTKLKIS